MLSYYLRVILQKLNLMTLSLDYVEYSIMLVFIRLSTVFGTLLYDFALRFEGENVLIMK